MTETQMTKIKEPREPDHIYLAMFEAFKHSYFGFVSDFGIRISNLSRQP
jgi:hypothetical protein